MRAGREVLRAGQELNAGQEVRPGQEGVAGREIGSASCAQELGDARRTVGAREVSMLQRFDIAAAPRNGAQGRSADPPSHPHPHPSPNPDPQQRRARASSMIAPSANPNTNQAGRRRVGRCGGGPN